MFEGVALIMVLTLDRPVIGEAEGHPISPK